MERRTLLLAGFVSLGCLVVVEAGCESPPPSEPPAKNADEITDSDDEEDADATDPEAKTPPSAPSAPATQCSDGLKNGTESGIDCGGSCTPCAAGLTCKVAADCASRSCVGGFCAAGDGGAPAAAGRLHLFSETNLKGATIVFDAPIADLDNGIFNDRARSLKIESGAWEVCEHSNFRGWCSTFTAGTVLDLGPASNRISSARPKALTP